MAFRCLHTNTHGALENTNPWNEVIDGCLPFPSTMSYAQRTKKAQIWRLQDSTLEVTTGLDSTAPSHYRAISPKPGSATDKGRQGFARVYSSHHENEQSNLFSVSTSV